MLVFATETSCDETSICLMKDKKIVEHITFSQEIHKKHGGVVPELASRAHLEKIQIMTNELFSRKNICLLYTSPSPRDDVISRMPSSA